MIINTRMRNWMNLVESHTLLLEKILPRKFWLAFDIPTDIPEGTDEWTHNRRVRINDQMDDLNQMRLRGVRGISDTREIVAEYFVGRRNAVLVMDPDETARLNNLTRVEYDNPDYLAKDNFRVLYRLFNKENSYGLDHDQMMINILQNFFRIAGQELGDKHLGGYPYEAGISDFTSAWEQRYSDFNIQNVEQAADAIWRLFIYGNENQTRMFKTDHMQALADLKPHMIDITRKTLLHMGSYYAEEGEWIVDNDALVIPPKSMLLISVYSEQFFNMEKYEEIAQKDKDGTLPIEDSMKWSSQKYKYESMKTLAWEIDAMDLESKYIIRYLDNSKFDPVAVKVKRKNARSV